MVQRLFRLPRLDRLEKAPLVPVDDHVNRKIAQVLTGQHVELPPRLTQARDAHFSDEADGVGKGDKRQRTVGTASRQVDEDVRELLPRKVEYVELLFSADRSPRDTRSVKRGVGREGVRR